MGYQLEGRLAEICTCNVFCPCWVGEDPDGGTCDGVLAWRVDRGTVNGTDVSGLTLATVVHIPGNIVNGNWRAVVYVDEKATPEQQEALLNVWTGKLGGPVADLAGLIGEVVAVERAPIAFEIREGKGSFTIGQTVTAEMTPFQGPTGQPTAVQDTAVLPTVPGSLAYVGKAPTYKVNAPDLGLDIDLQNHNAVQGTFSYTG